MTKQPRPQKLPSQTPRIPTPCGEVYVHVTFKDGLPFEVFARLGKTGGCTSAVVEGITRSMSLGLRSGVDHRDLVKTLTGIRCHRNPAWDEGEMVHSCVDAIGRGLQEAVVLWETEQRGNVVPMVAAA